MYGQPWLYWLLLSSTTCTGTSAAVFKLQHGVCVCVDLCDGFVGGGGSVLVPVDLCY